MRKKQIHTPTYKKITKIYFLFYDRQNCILFSEVFLKQVIEATNFFNTEGYVLYGLETQQVITGGWQGFTHWLKT